MNYDCVWSGRSIENMDIIFNFLRNHMIKKKISLDFKFFDWGCGEGFAMKQANKFFDCKCYGIDHLIPPNNNLKKNKNFTFHFPIDIMSLNNIPDNNTKTIVHYIYDGGVYPKKLSLHIANLIGKSINYHTFVIVILSKFPANVENKHLCVKKWKKALNDFSKLRVNIDVFENETVESTMNGYIFYRKN